MDINTIYTFLIYVDGATNVALALILFADTFSRFCRGYRNYQRARLLSAISIAIFGIGFLLHGTFMFRYTHPQVMSAVSMSYFHLGGTLFALSHTSLMNPGYITPRSLSINLSGTVLGLLLYWLPVFTPLHFSSVWGIAWFLIHMGYQAWRFYYTYYQTYQQMPEIARQHLHPFISSLPISCHLIVAFGFGGVVFSALFPDSLTVPIILMICAYFVFLYIYKALQEYGLCLLLVTETLKITSENNEEKKADGGPMTPKTKN